MRGNLTFQIRRRILKHENAETVRGRKHLVPPRETIYEVRGKFEITGSVHSMKNCGRPVTVAIKKNAFSVVQAFINSRKKSQTTASFELDDPPCVEAAASFWFIRVRP